MRILLINPGYTKGFQLFSLHFPPLGLASLAAYLRANGHEPVIWDRNVQADDQAPRPEDFDLVGVTSDTPRFPQTADIAGQVRSAGVPVVMGGSHVSFQAEEPLASGFADYVIRNEAETGLLALVDSLSQGGEKGLDQVGGLSYMDQGEVVHNPGSQVIQDVDRLPYPARDLLPMQDYALYLKGRKATSMISSRGCPFNCSFCASSQLFGLKWRPRSPESLVDEAERVQKEFGIGSIYFMDDNFTLDPERTIAFCELVLKRGLDLNWFCFSRANTIVEREDMVEAMSAAGAHMVFLGIESANPQVLKALNKKITTDTSVQAVDLLKQYRIKPMCSFIIGDVHEDKAGIQATIEFARKLAPEIAQFAILTPYPGTRLFEEAKDRILNIDWSFFDGVHATMRTDKLSPKELERLLKRAYISFYVTFQRLISSPGKLIWYMTRIRHLFA
ncbi:MAG: radical SAM protein [Desulfovermiculus sp.]